MLMKLDGIEKELQHGRSREEEFWGVRLYARSSYQDVYPDVDLFPVYCTSCEQQLPHIYYTSGSRYGLVGYFPCDLCGATITVIDCDYMVSYHDIHTAKGHVRIEYRRLYRLENEVWTVIKAKTGYDIFTLHDADERKGSVYEVPLGQVMDEICATTGIDPAALNQGHFGTDKRFNRLPAIVDRWLCLLHRLRI